MTVETDKATGRRELRFESLDDVLADAAHIVATETKTLGNWTRSQIIMHVARGINASIDGIDYTAPLVFRAFGRFLKNGVLNKEMKPGFRLPAKASKALVAEPSVTDEEAIETLRSAIERFEVSQTQPAHFVFGRMSHEDWRKLHLRHAELHFSFVVPV